MLNRQVVMISTMYSKGFQLTFAYWVGYLNHDWQVFIFYITNVYVGDVLIIYSLFANLFNKNLEYLSLVMV